MNPKLKKLFMIIVVISIIVLLLDGIFVIFTYVKKENNKGYEKAKITRYDNNKNKIWEKFYNKGYNSTFFNVKADEDSFVAVGSYEKTKAEKKDKTRTALFVKYDKNGEKMELSNMAISPYLL